MVIITRSVHIARPTEDTFLEKENYSTGIILSNANGPGRSLEH